MKLEKLSFYGVRNFNGEENGANDYEIELKPLTLIYGLHGTGKTAILEIIKFALTGVHPSSPDRLSAFISHINFTKPLNTQAIAKIKLTGEIQEQTSFEIIWKFKQIRAKGKLNPTVDCCIITIGTQDAENLSIKQAQPRLQEIFQIPFHIWDNVLLVTQENFDWPFEATSTVLKKIFDELFCIEDQNKILEEQRQKKKDLGNEITNLVRSVATLKKPAEEYEKLREDIIKLKEKEKRETDLESKATKALEGYSNDAKEIEGLKSVFEKLKSAESYFDKTETINAMKTFGRTKENIRDIVDESILKKRMEDLQNMSQNKGMTTKELEICIKARQAIIQKLQITQGIDDPAFQETAELGLENLEKLNQDRIKDMNNLHKEGDNITMNKEQCSQNIGKFQAEIESQNQEAELLKEKFNSDIQERTVLDHIENYVSNESKENIEHLRAIGTTNADEKETAIINLRMRQQKIIGGLEVLDDIVEDLEKFEETSFSPNTSILLEKYKKDRHLKSEEKSKIQHELDEKLKLLPIIKRIQGYSILEPIVGWLSKSTDTETEIELEDSNNSSLLSYNDSNQENMPFNELERSKRFDRERIQKKQFNQINTSIDSSSQSLNDQENLMKNYVVETKLLKQRIEIVDKEIQDSKTNIADLKTNLKLSVEYPTLVQEEKSLSENLKHDTDLYGFLKSAQQYCESLKINQKLLQDMKHVSIYFNLNNLTDCVKKLDDLSKNINSERIKEAKANAELIIATTQRKKDEETLEGRLLNAKSRFENEKKALELKQTQMIKLDNDIKSQRELIIDTHTRELSEINQLIHDSWEELYSQGDDIEKISINAAIKETDSEKRIDYDYFINMKIGENCLKMKGRASTGEKFIATFAIRCALAGKYAHTFPIFAFDNPNLGMVGDNLEKKLNALHGSNQIIITSTSKPFLDKIGTDEVDDKIFYELNKENGESAVTVIS